MCALRFGSCSMRSTVCGPAVARWKSTVRMRRAWPPPRWRTVIFWLLVFDLLWRVGLGTYVSCVVTAASAVAFFREGEGADGAPGPEVVVYRAFEVADAGGYGFVGAEEGGDAGAVGCGRAFGGGCSCGR